MKENTFTVLCVNVFLTSGLDPTTGHKGLCVKAEAVVPGFCGDVAKAPKSTHIEKDWWVGFHNNNNVFGAASFPYWAEFIQSRLNLRISLLIPDFL